MHKLRDLWARVSFEFWAEYADLRWKLDDRLRGRRAYTGNGRCGLAVHAEHPEWCGPDCLAWGGPGD